MAKNAKQQAAIAIAKKSENKMAKGGSAGGTALKNALIAKGYKKGGAVKAKKK